MISKVNFLILSFIFISIISVQSNIVFSKDGMSKLTSSNSNIRKNKNNLKSIKTIDKVGYSDETVNVISEATQSTSVAINGALTVLGGALVHLTLGTLYCWGNFLSYSPLNLRFFDKLDHPGSQPDALLVLPLTLVAQCLAVPFGPTLVKKYGAKTILLAGSWIMALGVYLSSYATNLYQFLFLYALVFGAGVGTAYTAPMIAGWKWLPKSKGLVSGAILTGFGAGGFFFNLIGTKIVNPKGIDPTNGKFPPEIYANFPVMLRTLALIYAGVSLLGTILVSEPKEVKTEAKSTTTAGDLPGLTLFESTKTAQFWLLWTMAISSASAGLNVASVYKQFASISPALSGDGFLSLVGGFGALFNGFGRLFWGTISDKIGFKNSFAILTVVQALVHALYPYSSSNKTLFLVSTCLCYFFLAGNFALIPPAVQRIFGPKSGATIYGVIYSAFGIASVGGLLLSKALQARLGWDGVFRVLAGLSLLSAVLTSFLTPVKSLESSQV